MKYNIACAQVSLDHKLFSGPILVLVGQVMSANARGSRLEAQRTLLSFLKDPMNHQIVAFSTCICMCICVYIHIYVYMHRYEAYAPQARLRAIYGP